MPAKLSFFEVKNFIDKEDLLLSTTYDNNKTPLQIQCGICSKIYVQTYDRYKRCHRHNGCKKNEKKIEKFPLIKNLQFLNQLVVYFVRKNLNLLKVFKNYVLFIVLIFKKKHPKDFLIR